MAKTDTTDSATDPALDALAAALPDWAALERTESRWGCACVRVDTAAAMAAALAWIDARAGRNALTRGWPDEPAVFRLAVARNFVKRRAMAAIAAAGLDRPGDGRKPPFVRLSRAPEWTETAAEPDAAARAAQLARVQREWPRYWQTLRGGWA